MSKQVLEYLKDNKDKYSQKQLIDALKKAGYSSQDIKKSVEEVYGSKAIFGFDLWDFKHKTVYTSKREKLGDLLFGVGVALVVSITFSFITFFGIFLFFILYILALIFTFNRRRYFFYGLLCYLLLLIILGIIGIFMVLGHFNILTLNQIL